MEYILFLQSIERGFWLPLINNTTAFFLGVFPYKFGVWFGNSRSSIENITLFHLQHGRTRYYENVKPVRSFLGNLDLCL